MHLPKKISTLLRCRRLCCIIYLVSLLIIAVFCFSGVYGLILALVRTNGVDSTVLCIPWCCFAAFVLVLLLCTIMLKALNNALSACAPYVVELPFADEEGLLDFLKEHLRPHILGEEGLYIRTGNMVTFNMFFSRSMMPRLKISGHSRSAAPQLPHGNSA